MTGGFAGSEGEAVGKRREAVDGRQEAGIF